MTTIQEIRDALKWYDDTRPEYGHALFKAEFELLKVAPEYLRTLLAEIDKAEQERDALRADVAKLREAVA